MVDCFDRIAVHMTELALEPVRMLAQCSMLGAVSLRTPSNGRRYLVTISKRFPQETAPAATYIWAVEEITQEGDAAPNGLGASCPTGAAYSDPEDAYWAAVNGLCQITS